jgi:hypothetical protein
MFCAPGLVWAEQRASGPFFYARTHFRRYQGRIVPFSCFALLDSFSTVSKAPGPVLMLCVVGLVLRRTEGVGSRLHVLHSRTRFGRYRERRVPSSCFARSVPFWAVSRASGPVFMFCVARFISGNTERVESQFHILHSLIHFLRNRGSRVSYSCFALPDSFSAESRELGPVFMFCTPGPILCGIEGVGSSFHVLRSRTHFLWNIRSRVPYSCFAFLDPFWAVPRAPGPVFRFCAAGFV